LQTPFPLCYFTAGCSVVILDIVQELLDEIEGSLGVILSGEIIARVISKPLHKLSP